MRQALHLSPQLYQPELIERKGTRDGYGEAVVKAGEKDADVVVLTADLSESTRSNLFQKTFPERFFEMGVSEQNLMSVAAGLALSGKVPFVASYAVFNPGGNWVQLRLSVCYSQANVKVIGGHTGLTVGEDGATHQALEDIAIARVLPNLTVICPCDYWQSYQATLAAAQETGPMYLRLTRSSSPMMTTEKTPFQIGRAQVLRSGRDVTLVGCGPILYEAVLAAEKLEQKDGISVEVINMHTIKPLDEKTLLHSVMKTKAVVTIEEHQIAGGMGSAIAEVLARNLPVPIEFLGMSDKFGESGKPEQLLKKYQLTSAHVMQAVHQVLRRKRI
jgi:transketolase